MSVKPINYTGFSLYLYAFGCWKKATTLTIKPGKKRMKYAIISITEEFTIRKEDNFFIKKLDPKQSNVSVILVFGHKLSLVSCKTNHQRQVL